MRISQSRRRTSDGIESKVTKRPIVRILSYPDRKRRNRREYDVIGVASPQKEWLSRIGLSVNLEHVSSIPNY